MYRAYLATEKFAKFHEKKILNWYYTKANKEIKNEPIKEEFFSVEITNKEFVIVEIENLYIIFTENINKSYVKLLHYIKDVKILFVILDEPDSKIINQLEINSNQNIIYAGVFILNPFNFNCAPKKIKVIDKLPVGIPVESLNPVKFYSDPYIAWLQIEKNKIIEIQYYQINSICISYRIVI